MEPVLYIYIYWGLREEKPTKGRGKGSQGTHLQRVTPRDLVEKTLKVLERESEEESERRGW